MLLDLFERDLRSRTFGEYSSISQADQGSIRLKVLEAVKAEIDRTHEPLIVCKPLVESQRTLELLHYFPGSKALWAYRDYNDVINSSINAFHSQIESCRIIVDNDTVDWRSEVVPAESLQLIRNHYTPTMNPYDAAALMWHARNSLYAEQQLWQFPAIRLWKYEDFVANPAEMVLRIYGWLGMSPPSRRVSHFVNPRSVGVGQNVKLNDEIDNACNALLSLLNERYASPRIGNRLF